MQHLELSLGARQLVLTLTAPPPGGGRMPVVLVPRGDTPPGTVTVAAAITVDVAAEPAAP